MSDQVYKAYYGELGERRRQYTKTRVDWIIENVIGERVLDVGCSQGICSIFLGGKGKKVLGIDLNEESIQFAQEKLQQNADKINGTVTFEKRDFLEWDFSPNKFDTIIMTQVLEHLENPCSFIEKAMSLLEENGRLIVTVPFGINEAPDHKRTYYLGELYKQVEPFCSVEEAKIEGHWLGFICSHSNKDPKIQIRDLNIMLMDEEGFYRIERELLDLSKSRRERNLILENQREKLKQNNYQLEQSNQECQKKIQEHENKIDELRLEIDERNKETNELTAEVGSLNGLLNKKASEYNQLNIRLKSSEREKRAAKAAYHELAKSKLGRIQLAYWHSPNMIARIARFVIRGLKSIFLGKKNNNEEKKMIQVDMQNISCKNANSEQEKPNKSKQREVIKIERNRFTRIEGSKNTILFMATNGAGLGHLTRSMAIARRIRSIDPNREIVFLTTSIAVNTLHKEGFLAYHIPPKALLPAEMTSAQWGEMLRSTLMMLFSLYDIKTVVFDGAYPYAPFVRYIGAQGELKKIWVKRGSEKPETKATRQEQEKFFDHILIPSEMGQEMRQNDSRHAWVNPIVFIDKDELLSRNQVRRLFKIPDDKLFVYVQLGAGSNYNLQERLDCVFAALRKKGNIMIALGESIIGDALQIYEDDIVIIKDYPNSKYFSGFDFVISACGYNTFHELMYFGVPTLFLPIMETGTDDQMSRAMLGVKAGVAMALSRFDENEIEQAIEKLSDREENLKMRKNAEDFSFSNGAEAAAKYIMD